MIALAWHTARARVASLAGSFVALALGVALLAAMALTLAATVGTHARPTWFARAGVVIAGDDTVSIPSGEEGAGPETLRTAGARAVPAALVRPLSALGRGPWPTTQGTLPPRGRRAAAFTRGRRRRCTGTPG